MLYVIGLTVNLISTVRLWRNKIGVYFFTSQLAKLFFNRTIFIYTDNIKDQFILYYSIEELAFKIVKPTTNLKIWYSWLIYLNY